MDTLIPAALPSVPERLPTVQEVWGWLADVADPEIPVISVTELGIVRDVALDDAPGGPVCVVTVTPTYSGCPATAVISRSIEDALAARGVPRVRLDLRLSPAWTTDWITPEGRAKLKDYGIAPPGSAAVEISGLSRRRDEPPVECPRCGSARTRLVSRFGSTPCKALHQCMDCREPFDHFKSH